MAGAREILKGAMRAFVEAALKVYLATVPRVRFSPERVERILVFAYHGLGNFIMYTTALRQLRKRYPNARIDLQVGNNTGCEDVLAGSGLFDNIYNLPYTAGLSAWAKRAREIRATRYDLTINEFHSHSWRLAMLVAASRAPFRIGHVTSPGWSRRFSRYGFIFNLPVRMREDEHEVERYLDLVEAAGAEAIPLDQARTYIHLSEDDREYARNFYGPWLSDGSALIGIQPGTSPAMRWKQWPLDRYRQLIEQLLAESTRARIILFGSPGEAGMIADLVRGLESQVAIAAGKTTVKQVAALIERCDLLICNDSGLMHAAVAVKTPVVAIYGPTDIRRTAPLGPQHTIVRHEMACSPCFKLEGDDQVHLCQHHDCLMSIAPDEVLNAVKLTTVKHKERSQVKSDK